MERAFFDLSTGVALFLLGLTVLAEGILGGLILFCHLSDGNYEVIRKTMILLPALVFISLYALNTSLLNCERSYFLPSVAPTALNVIWIGAIFLVRKFPIAQAIDYLAMLIVLAFILQWGVTLPKVIRYLYRELGKKWQTQRFSGREMLQIVRPFTLGMIGVAATQINSGLDAIFARAAEVQGPAYLWYALRIQQLPIALIGVGLTGALLPPIARAIQRGEPGHYLEFLNFSLKKIVLFMLPMTAALYVLGYSGVNLLYGRGEFSQIAIEQTTLCLWAYGLALLPITVVLICASAFYAHKNYKVPSLTSVYVVCLSVLLNACLVFIFHLGSLSIAIATAVSAGVNSLMLIIKLKKAYGINFQGVLSLFLKTITASLFAAATALLFGYVFFQDNTLAVLLGKEMAPFPKELFQQLVVFVSLGSIFTFAFIGAAFLLRIPEFKNFSFLKWRLSLVKN